MLTDEYYEDEYPMEAERKAELIERWQNVERVLTALSPHDRERHWDMMHWGYVTECGTVACAAGHCALDPWFQERGFRAAFRPMKDKDVPSELYGWPVGETRASWMFQVRDFFGVEGARNIFQNPGIRPVEVVIDEVREHIEWLRRCPVRV